jgi:hypothetical protein
LQSTSDRCPKRGQGGRLVSNLKKRGKNEWSRMETMVDLVGNNRNNRCFQLFNFKLQTPMISEKNDCRLFNPNYDSELSG